MVPPGTYQVKLSVSGKDYTAPLEIKADPRVKATQADLVKQYEFALKVRDRVNEVHNAVNQIRAARTSLDSTRQTDSSKAQAIGNVEQKMAAIEEALTQVKSTSTAASLVYPIMLDAQYADLGNVAEAADSAPPAQVYEVFQDYEHRWADLSSRWKALQGEIAKLGITTGAKAGDQ